MLNLSPQQFATWDEPIEMLYACHSKVKQFCQQLQLLPDYLEQNGCTQALKNDVQQILIYFNQAAPLHHDDEELDFFPTLVKQLPQVKTDIATLEAQHHRLHQNWDRLSIQLTALLDGKIVAIDPELIAEFIAGYEQHIAIEEPLFELGRDHLTQEELGKIGKIMANRRQ